MKILLALALVLIAVAADPPGFAHFTAQQLTEKEPALIAHAKSVKSGVASEVIGNWGNHALQTVHRETSGQAEYHEGQNDVIIIRKGAGSIIIGGKIVKGETVSPGEIRGEGIEGGETVDLKAGDIIHIPIKTPHQMLLNKGGKLDYIAIKVEAK